MKRFRNILIGVAWALALLYAVRHVAEPLVLLVVAAGAALATALLLVLERQGTGTFLGSVAVLGWCVLSSWMVHFTGSLQQQFALLMGFGAVFVVFVVGLVNRHFAGGKLGRQDLAVLYMMLLVAVPLAIVFRGSLEAGIRNLHETLASKPAYHYVKSWQAATSEDAVTGYFDGPMEPLTLPEAAVRAVPWGEWLLPMFYWGALFLSFQVFWLFLVAIFRRRWVEEERLPFPWTLPALQVIEAGAGDSTPEVTPEVAARNVRARGVAGMELDEAGRKRDLTEKAMRWGLVLGFGVTVPGLLPSLWEGFWSPVGIPPNPNTWGVDLTDLGIFEGVELKLAFDPFVIVAAMFLPVDFLLTLFLTFVGLRMIIPWCLAKIGIPGYSSWIYRRMYMSLRTGGIVGVPLWMLWYARDHIKKILLNLGGRKGLPGKPREGEEGRQDREVSSWNDLFIGMILSGAAFVVLCSFCTTWKLLLLALLMIFFLNFAYFRLRSEGAFLTYAPYHSLKSMGHWQKHLVGDWATEQAWHAAVPTASLGVVARLVGPQTYFGEPFRIGSEVGLHPRKVFRSVLIAIVLVLVFTGPLFLIFAYQHGVRGTTVEEPTGWGQYTSWVYFAFHWATQEMPNTFKDSRYWFWILLGVGLYGLLFYLRREIVGWKINPVAVLAASILPGVSQLTMKTIWASVLIALVLKAVLFRWYGVRSYRQKIQPVLAWALVGMSGGMLLLIFFHALRGEGVWQSPVDILFNWINWARGLFGGS